MDRAEVIAWLRREAASLGVPVATQDNLRAAADLLAADEDAARAERERIGAVLLKEAADSDHWWLEDWLATRLETLGAQREERGYGVVATALRDACDKIDPWLQGGCFDGLTPDAEVSLAEARIALGELRKAVAALARGEATRG